MTGHDLRRLMRGLKSVPEKMDFDAFSENYRDEHSNPPVGSGPNDVSVCGLETVEGGNEIELIALFAGVLRARPRRQYGPFDRFD